MSDEQAATGEDSKPLTSVVASVVTMLTLVAGFGLFAVGWPHFWIVFPIGFGGVLPAATSIAGWQEAKRRQTETVRQTGAGGKLAVLRERYARGEIDEATFERRLEGLLETESIDDAKQFYGDEVFETEQTETASDETTDRIPDDERA